MGERNGTLEILKKAFGLQTYKITENKCFFISISFRRIQ